MFGNINPEIPRKHSKYFKETFYTGYSAFRGTEENYENCIGRHFVNS